VLQVDARHRAPTIRFIGGGGAGGCTAQGSLSSLYWGVLQVDDFTFYCKAVSKRTFGSVCYS
jgi:hypothetical protein